MFNSMVKAAGLVVVLGLVAVPAARAADKAKQDKPADGAQPAQQHEPAKPGEASPAVKKVSIDEFEKMRKQKDAVVLDVRSREEYEAGHIPGSVNLPINAKDFDERVKKLDKDKTYLVHCAVGGRSARASAKMHEAGVPKLFDFSGGMRAWTEAEKPVEQGAAKSGSKAEGEKGRQ
jgi:rhodanese-related sulfurtransferase